MQGFPTLCKFVKAALSCFHGPQVECSFSSMNNIINSKSNSMDVSTYSALQTIRYNLKVCNKSAITYFHKPDFQHDMVYASLVKNMQKACEDYSQELLSKPDSGKTFQNKRAAIEDICLDAKKKPGYRIPVLENLGATLDQFDTIDFTDNDIRKLDKFPLLKRLKHILLSNNRIVRISEHLEENLPNLETLILTNNGLKELSDLEPLGSISTLKHLSLLGNPVTARKNYRYFLIYKIPTLRVLDFSRVRLKEREAAAKLFKKKKGQQQLQQTVELGQNGSHAKTFTPGEKLTPPRLSGPSKQDVAAIKKAIAQAKTLEEIERLNQLLKSGQIPGQDLADQRLTPGQAGGQERFEEEVEEEEEEEEDEREENEAAGYQQMEADEDDDDQQNMDDD